MNEKDVKQFLEVSAVLEELKKEYNQKKENYQKIYDDFYFTVSDWFDNFYETDERIKELHFIDYSNRNPSISIKADKGIINFNITEEFYGDYTQYFDCDVPIDKIPLLLNGDVSLWDFNPNTEEISF